MSGKLNILGFEVDNVDLKSAVLKVGEFLKKDKPSYIVTLNSELVVRTSREYLRGGDIRLSEIVKEADMVVADSAGVLLSSKILSKKFNKGERLKGRVAGVDLMLEICKEALRKNLKCFLVGGAPGSGEFCEKKLKEIFGNELKIVGCLEKGDGSEWYDDEAVGEINKVKPDVVFVAYGGGKQERWIHRNKDRLSGVKVLMGVGGSFDFITGLKPINAGKLNFGKTKRAPQFFQRIWMEWLWRLFWQPWRVRRVLDAIIGMIYYTLRYYFFIKNEYRPNVMVGVYKEEGGEKKFLLCSREDDHDHWQFVQGGIDKEETDILEAAKREMKEEIGLENEKVFEMEEVLGAENRYIWPIGRALIHKKYRFKGQEQKLVLVKYFGDDKRDLDLENNWAEDLFYDYKWVSLKDVLKEVHPLRREAVKLFLEDEIWKRK